MGRQVKIWSKWLGATPPPAPEQIVQPPASGVVRDRFLAAPLSGAQQLAKLGIEGPSKNSQILTVLGKERFAEVTLVRVPGRVAWFNPELARLLGFDVPPSGKLTKELEEQLLAALSWRVLEPGEKAPPGAEVITGYADRYGGVGVGYNRGAGRAAFLPTLNANIKGAGKTPLVDKNQSFDHAHGGAPMREGFLESIWGEVGSNLFSSGSTRVLAVIDSFDHTQWKDGGKERRARIIRLGDQLRPAHLLDSTIPQNERAPLFLRMAQATGTLVAKPVKGDLIPDVAATMQKLIERHARTAAEQFRWRVLHGATNPSNIELDATELDLGTIQSQPRTARIKALAHGNDPRHHFGSEHEGRGSALAEIYEVVRSSLSWSDRSTLNATKLDVTGALEKAYQKELQLQILKAVGLKEDAAIALQKNEPDCCRQFSDLFLEMSRLKNPGNILADTEVVREVAVLDVFNLLRELPALHFSPSGATIEDVKQHLRAIVRGTPSQEKATQAEVDRLAGKFLPLYRQLLAAVDSAFYDDKTAMRRSITARAHFENEPLDQLYRGELCWKLNTEISQYEGSGDAARLGEVVDNTIAASIRNVDQLLSQGEARLTKTGAEIAIRSVDGIRHSVIAEKSGKRRLHLETRVSGNNQDGYVLHDLPGAPQLNKTQIEALRYWFTTDGWKTKLEAAARFEDGKVQFDIPVLPSDAGRLEGLFHCTAGGFWLKDGASNFKGYAFAVPDGKELARIESKLSGG